VWSVSLLPNKTRGAFAQLCEKNAETSGKTRKRDRKMRAKKLKGGRGVRRRQATTGGEKNGEGSSKRLEEGGIKSTGYEVKGKKGRKKGT